MVTDDRRRHSLVTTEVIGSDAPVQVIIDGDEAPEQTWGGGASSGAGRCSLSLRRQGPSLMYKYCGGTQFPNLLSDYKRNGVETIRDAGSHVSFL